MAKFTTRKTGNAAKRDTLKRREILAVKYRPAPPLAMTALAVGARLIGGDK